MNYRRSGTSGQFGWTVGWIDLVGARTHRRVQQHGMCASGNELPQQEHLQSKLTRELSFPSVETTKRVNDSLKC